MPGDRLPLAVRVRCEIDAVRFFHELAKARQKLALAADRNILRFIIMFYIDSHFALGKIADMTV